MHEESTDRLQISIFGLWRDSKEYIDKTLSQLEALETIYDLSYYFYENDSTDNTPTILKEWMEGRKGKLHSEVLGDEKYGNKESAARQVTRDEKMSSYRNALVKLGKDDGVDSEWSIVFDTDTEFDANVIKDFLKCHYEGVVMMTPHVEQTVKCHICEPPCKKLSYYDSYALRTKENPMRSVTFGCNPFWEEHNRKRYNKGEPIEVECAFGSFAMIKTAVLFKSKWGTDGDCEHVFFTKDVRKEGKIIVCPTVKIYTKITGVKIDNSFIEWQRACLKDVWALKTALLTTRNNSGPTQSYIEGGKRSA